MSDPIELETENICTSEDAFEKFQSTSLYEQEEFITLSDLVSPEASHCDVENEVFVGENVELSTNADVMVVADNVEISTCTDNADLSYEDEKKYGSSDAEGTRHEDAGASNNINRLKTSDKVSIQPDTDTNELNMVNIVETTCQSTYTAPSNVEEETDNTKRQRGRPSKRPRGRPQKVQQNTTQSSELDTSSDWSASEQNNTSYDSINKSAPTIVLKKRGRKPKPKTIEPIESPQKLQEKISSTTENSDCPETHKTLSSNINRNKRYFQTSDTTTSEADSTNNLNSANQDTELYNNERKSSRRVSKKRYMSDDWFRDDDTEFQSYISPTNKPDSSDINTPKKKRGRPKKVQQNNISSDTSVSDNKLDTTNDDIVANVSTALKIRSGTISKSNNEQELTDKLEKQATDSAALILNSEKGQLQTETEPHCSTANNTHNSDDDDLSLLSLKSKKPDNSKPENIIQDTSIETLIPAHDVTIVNTTDHITQESQLVSSHSSNVEIDQPIVSDPSGRPVRRVIRKPVHYDEGSDEDPFANVELSDDDANGKKGRYYSDDEYVPHEEKKRKGKPTHSDSSDSEILDEVKKKKSTKHDGVSPKKRGRKSKAEKAAEISGELKGDSNNDSNDVVGNNDNWISPKYNDAFESFLAQKIKGTSIKIKKVSNTEISDNTLTPLQIPVIDPTEINKSVETSCQTETVPTKSLAVQTSSLYNIPMKTNVTLSKEQSTKACELLSNIVNTTVELGQLMTQKSEDFIKRKINVQNVTDTLKMDYCVKKSFLLFKLAKHNLTQMEEDLAAQYSTFLKEQSLSWCREEDKEIAAKPKEDSDSDCEIVEVKQPEPIKPKFNPKTVFLNKELSIKITKKPEDKKEIPIKGRNSLWITKSVMLKKIKPSQSFLAQDSRNKKPPDEQFVTKAMVSNFLQNYYQKKIYNLCRDVASARWLKVNYSCECYHFVTNVDFQNPSYGTEFENIATTSSNSNITEVPLSKHLTDPETLFTLCTRILQRQLHGNCIENNKSINNNLDSSKQLNCYKNPKSLFSCCVDVLQRHIKNKCISKFKRISYNSEYDAKICSMDPQNIEGTSKNGMKPKSLIKSCLQVLNTESNYLKNIKLEKVNIVEEMCNEAYSPTIARSLSISNETSKSLYEDITEKETPDDNIESEESYSCSQLSSPKTLSKLCIEKIQEIIQHDHPKNGFKKRTESNNYENRLKLKNALSLQSISYNSIMKILQPIKLISDKIREEKDLRASRKNRVKSLFSLCVAFLQQIQIEEQYQCITKDNNLTTNTPQQLKQIALKSVCSLFYNNQELDDAFANESILMEPFTINSVNTLSEEAFCNIATTNEETTSDVPEESEYADDESDAYDYENDSHFNDIAENDQTHDQNSWLSQVQMKELRSCLDTATHQVTCNESNIQPVLVSVKTEPIEECPFNIDISIVKTEPVHNPDEMTIIPESVISKSEPVDLPEIDYLGNKENALGYEIEPFETLIRNKIAGNTSVFSQSEQRVYRQHEPDYDEEYDVNNSLLIPQTYETIHLVNAKDSLMKSSSDEEGGSKRVPNKKKSDKRRGKPKKPDPKPLIKEKTRQEKGKEKPSNEIETLTKKNKEKIGQEEQKIDSVSTENKISIDVRNSKGDEEENVKRRLRGRIIPEEKKIDSSSPKNDVPPETSIRKDSEIDNLNKRLRSRRGQEEKKIDNSNSDISIDVPTSKENEVENITKRLREKLRQEEKKIEDSDSETEIPLDIRKGKGDKSKKNVEVHKVAKTKTTTSNVNEAEIQCNNVDSTQQFQDNDSSQEPTDVDTFIGFSSTDQRDTDQFHEYLNQLYNKLNPDVSNEKHNNASQDITESSAIPKKNKITTEIENDLSNENMIPDSYDEVFDDRSESPLINYEDPAEELQCEPTLPVFDDIVNEAPKKLKQKKTPNVAISNEPKYTERNGWHCYQIDSKDAKLYQKTEIVLDKLPESFVNMYFQYQDIAVKDHQDREIERLTDLTSLNRLPKEVRKRGRPRKKDPKLDKAPEDVPPVEELAPEAEHELSPSEDENDAEDNIPPAMPIRHPENMLAKNSLMDDSGDEQTPVIKQEPVDRSFPQSIKKKIPGPKSKTLPEVKSDKPVMLTADIVMNTELNLLHAPVVLQEDAIPSTSKGPVTRNKVNPKPKSVPNQQEEKNKDDSSSEEEKLWVNTKEKLLKRLEKKDNASVEDAKRAKLVTEFIERRGDSRKRVRNPRYRKSKKFLLEREKQLKSLSRELYGEEEGGPVGKKSGSSLFKGRRNIRKVIDKKSLRHRTVLANMEELERKRRLHVRQARLREHLGCEEDVNVLVINDEVCLEYDFDENRPVVTIHPFFTKVMKAHQYEGVKFMWDACFESLDHIAGGKPGSGCILAHCMGLGKTLQVLALLHTVLTHPGVGIHRVLVCCPLSTVLNWVDEIHKWIGPVTNQIKVFELSKLKKTYERAYQLEDWYNGGGIFIIGYELFRSLSTLDAELDDIRPTIVNKIRTALLDPGPDVIVCDEGHLLKNDCSVLAVAMSRVVTKRRIVLTGTPMQNNLREYYCMVNFIKPNLLGTYSEFSNRFENPIMNGQHRDSREEDIKLMKARTHILHKVLEGCLQRQEASVLYPYLPKKHEYTVFISLTQCQWDLYKHYLNNYAKQTKHSILKDFHILQKIWSHPQVLHIFQTKSRDAKAKVKAEKLEDDLAHEDITSEDIKPETEVWWLQYLDDGKMLDCLESSNKFLAVFRILDECIELGDKVLIFSTSLFTLDALEYFLRKIKDWSLGHDYYRLDGSVPPEVRQKWCREFNAENNLKTKLFLISTRAGSLGLNMTAANRVIILDTSWNPAHDIQSIFRVYRFGQRKDCYIYRFVAMGTMEQKIYERSVTKQAVACRVVDEQQIDRHYNSAELTELYRFDETGASVAGGVAVGVGDVALLRVARDASIHAVHEHDSLLRGSSEAALPEHERAAVWMQFQQEQAHRQMQNDLAANNPKMVNKIPGHEYSKPPILLKSGRPKKNTNNIPPLPPPPKEEPPQEVMTPNADRDEHSLIGEVVKILCRYNFKMNHGEDLIALINNVRNIVATKKPIADAVSVEIAGMLLQQRNMTMPMVTAVVCEAIKKCVIIENFKSQAEAQNYQVEGVENVPSGSGTNKRKTTHEHDDSIIPDILNADDDDDDIQIIEITPEPDSLLKEQLSKPLKKVQPSRSGDISINENINKRNSETTNIPSEKHVKRKKEKDENINQSKTDAPAVLPETIGKRKKEIKTYSKSSKPKVPENVKTTTTINVTNKEKTKPVEKPKTALDILKEERQKQYEKRRKRRLLRRSAKSNIQYDTESENDEESILLESDNETEARQTEAETNKQTTEPDKNIQKICKIEIEVENENEQRKDDSSILLSDDDEPAKKSSKTEKSKPEKVVPLHPSLLANENFIKIVAHTYLNGNPKLDQDAALLAAQYSTLKALKEVEATGKLIDSGPIYDIAVKQLGFDILMKMHGKGNSSKLTKRVEHSAANLLQKSLNNIENQFKEIKENNSTSQQRVSVKSNLMPEAKPTVIKLKKVTSAPVTPKEPVTQQVNKVVPVKMFKYPTVSSERPGTAANEECILPDDDDVIVSDIIPDNYIIGTQTELKQQSSAQTMRVNKITAGSSKNVTPTIWPGVVNTSEISNANVQQVAQPLESTICLDSDEESPFIMPHPVSMSFTPTASTSQAPPTATPIALPYAPISVPTSLPFTPVSIPSTQKNQTYLIIGTVAPDTVETPKMVTKTKLPFKPVRIAPKIPATKKSVPTPEKPALPPEKPATTPEKPASTPKKTTTPPKNRGPQPALAPTPPKKQTNKIIASDLLTVANEVVIKTSEKSPIRKPTDPRSVLQNVIQIVAPENLPQPRKTKPLKLLPVNLPPNFVPIKPKPLKKVTEMPKKSEDMNGTRTYIDLTDIIAKDSAKSLPSGSGSKIIKLGKSMTIVGKPSDIALHSKKTVCLITNSGKSNKEESNKPSTSTSEKNKTKKRLITAPRPEPAKKKKIEQMTLQDFDIDNIDDIIELD